MKKILGLMIVAVLLLSVQSVWADDSMGNAAGMSTPGMSAAPATTPAAKAKKAKKAKKAVKKETQAAWVCPMGDYSGPKTADGKCPKCGMDLVEKK